MSLFSNIVLELVNIHFNNHINIAVKRGVNLIGKTSVNIKWNAALCHGHGKGVQNMDSYAHLTFLFTA